MNECLVTKLKGTVDNDDLLKYGEFKFKFNADPGNVITISNVKTNSVYKIKGEGYFTDSTGVQNYGKEFTAAAGEAYFIATGVGEVICQHKYDMNLFTVVRGTYGSTEMNVEDFSYSSNNITYLVIGNSKLRGQVTKLNGKVNNAFSAELFDDQENLASFVRTFLDATNTSETNHILQLKQDFNANINNVNLNMFEGRIDLDVRVSGAYGDFKYIGDTRATAWYTPMSTAPRITGSLEEFVQRAIASGRPNGITLSYPKHYTNLTYQGTPLSENANIPDVGQIRINWTDQGEVIITQL